MSHLVLAQATATHLPLASESVQCVVTSPPYWGLRSYTGEQRQVWGGEEHAHEWGERVVIHDEREPVEHGKTRTTDRFYGDPSRRFNGNHQKHTDGAFCACGAIKCALGLEPEPAMYVEHIVQAFREVKRVLRSDGCVFLNLGDSYASMGRSGRKESPGVGAKQEMPPVRTAVKWQAGGGHNFSWTLPGGQKPKDLVGIPWRVAFALQADGWWLRSDIVWAKPNPMPESVTDRPTRSHEYVFLLTKSASYYYDADAIREAGTTYKALTASRGVAVGGKHDRTRINGNVATPAAGRNARSVWNIATQPYPGAHFATFPEALAERCILAGSRPAGKRCDCDELILTPNGDGGGSDPTMATGRAGFNRERGKAEGTRPITRREQRSYAAQIKSSPHRATMASLAGAGLAAFGHYIRVDRSGARPLPQHLLDQWIASGWLSEPEPCRCPNLPPDIVLDPFAGTGTVARVAIRHGRSAVGLDISREYLREQAMKRVDKIQRRMQV